MIALFRTLSLSSLRRQALQMTFALLGIASGVATFASIRVAQTALVGGLTDTIGQLAGTADLQVSGVGGVPESLRDQVVQQPGVRSASPAIEEVVALEPASLGSVLILGVDLVGDRGIRNYRFEGPDADVDDPLVFLAQQDSVAISRPLADRLHVEKGDALTVRVHDVSQRLVIRAILGEGPLSNAFGGAIAITDVYAAQTLLSRGQRFDRLEIAADRDTPVETLRTTLHAAIGDGYTVLTPEDRGESARTLIQHFDASFTASRLLGVVIATFLVSNVFTVTSQRRRRDIGIMRSLGATSFQVEGLLFAEAAILGAVGGIAGLFVGWLAASAGLSVMRESIARLYGLTSAAQPAIGARLIIESIGLGTLAAVAGAWGPTRAACDVPVMDALAGGAFASRRTGLPRTSLLVLAAAVLVFAVGYARPSEDETWFLFATLIPMAVALSLLSAPVSELVLSLTARLLPAFRLVSMQVALDALRSQPRRTAAAMAGMLMTLGFALGIGSHMRALNDTFTSWIDRMYRDDLYVRASSGFAPSKVKISWTIGEQIAGVPGVARVSGLRYDLVSLDRRPAMLAAADVSLMSEWLRRDRVDGSTSFSAEDLSGDTVCLISDNLARQRHLHPGDALTLTTPVGPATFRIGAVIDLLLSEFGVVVVNRATFNRYWHDDRVDLFRVAYRPGASGVDVQRDIAAMVTGTQPALISTRSELVDAAHQAIDSFVVFTRLTALMAAGVAFINVVTTLLISVGERTRELGLLRALGAVSRQIVGTVMVEATVVTIGGLLLAMPVGMALAWLFTHAVMTTYFGFAMQPTFAFDLLLMLAVTLPLVAALAAWLPASRAAGLQPRVALGHD